MLIRLSQATSVEDVTYSKPTTLKMQCQEVEGS